MASSLTYDLHFFLFLHFVIQYFPLKRGELLQLVSVSQMANHRPNDLSVVN